MSKEKLYVSSFDEDLHPLKEGETGIWVLSFKKKCKYWGNDDVFSGFGLLKEDAEEIAKRYNEYAALNNYLNSLMDIVESLRDKTLYESSPQWQPMNNAPKNGDRILVFQPAKGKDEVLIAFYNELCESFVNDVPNGSMLTPKYWQPIPKPPKRNDDVAAN